MTEELNTNMRGEPVELSDNQRRFVELFQAEGVEVYAYSGRGMYGATCPAVNVSDPEDYSDPNGDYVDEDGEPLVGFMVDNMGLEFVLYARS